MTINSFNGYRSQFFAGISNLPASHQAKVSEYLFLAAKDGTYSGHQQTYLTITKKKSAIAKKTTITALLILLVSGIIHIILLSLNSPYINQVILPILAITTLSILITLSIYRLIKVVHQIIELYSRYKNLKNPSFSKLINFQKNEHDNNAVNRSFSYIKLAFKQAQKTIKSQMRYHIISIVGVSIIILSSILLITTLTCVLSGIGIMTSIYGFSLQQVVLMSAGTLFCIGILWNVSLSIISIYRKNKNNHSAQQIVNAVKTMAHA